MSAETLPLDQQSEHGPAQSPQPGEFAAPSAADIQFATALHLSRIEGTMGTGAADGNGASPAENFQWFEPAGQPQAGTQELPAVEAEPARDERYEAKHAAPRLRMRDRISALAKKLEGAPTTPAAAAANERASARPANAESIARTGSETATVTGSIAVSDSVYGYDRLRAHSLESSKSVWKHSKDKLMKAGSLAMGVAALPVVGAVEGTKLAGKGVKATRIAYHEHAATAASTKETRANGRALRIGRMYQAKYDTLEATQKAKLQATAGESYGKVSHFRNPSRVMEAHQAKFEDLTSKQSDKRAALRNKSTNKVTPHLDTASYHNANAGYHRRKIAQLRGKTK